MKFISINQETLICPECGLENLHQEKVESVFRDREDYDGTHVSHNKGGVLITRKVDGDIGGRREIAHIHFSCEHCPNKIYKLTIQQHKGATYLYWNI